jgi:predicted SnoaL-like aldol condensation-catalyzing enzyme
MKAIGVLTLVILGGPCALAQSEPSARAEAEMNKKLVQQFAQVTANLESNKKVVLEFLRMQNDPQARGRLLSDEYVEHNPRYRAVEDAVRAYGSEGWIKAGLQTNGGKGLVDPDFTFSPGSAPVAVLAEGDVVAVVLKATLPDPDDASKTYEACSFEMFLLAGGKIAHHWDGVKLTKDWAAELQHSALK